MSATVNSEQIEHVAAALRSHIRCRTTDPDRGQSEDQHVFPWEDAQVVERLAVHTVLAKVLLIHGEWAAGRTTVVIVREPVGI